MATNHTGKIQPQFSLGWQFSSNPTVTVIVGGGSGSFNASILLTGQKWWQDLTDDPTTDIRRRLADSLQAADPDAGATWTVTDQPTDPMGRARITNSRTDGGTFLGLTFPTLSFAQIFGFTSTSVSVGFPGNIDAPNVSQGVWIPYPSSEVFVLWNDSEELIQTPTTVAPDGTKTQDYYGGYRERYINIGPFRAACGLDDYATNPDYTVTLFPGITAGDTNTALETFFRTWRDTSRGTDYDIARFYPDRSDLTNYYEVSTPDDGSIGNVKKALTVYTDKPLRYDVNMLLTQTGES